MEIIGRVILRSFSYGTFLAQINFLNIILRLVLRTVQIGPLVRFYLCLCLAVCGNLLLPSWRVVDMPLSAVLHIINSMGN